MSISERPLVHVVHGDMMRREQLVLPRGAEDRLVGSREGEDLLVVCFDTEVDLVLHVGSDGPWM